MDLKAWIIYNGYTIKEIADALDVLESQIHRWNTKGISTESKYYPKLKELIPEVSQIATTKLNKDGTRTQRVSSGRKKKELILYDTELPAPKYEIERKSDRPKIIFKK